MANSKQTSGKSFLVQGSILAVAGVITKIIGAVYRVPLVNIMGDTGMGYYGVAFQIYAIALTLTSYSLPLAVSKLVSARVAVGQYRNAYKVFRGALAFAITVGGTAALIIFFGAGFIASELMAMSLSAYALRVLAPCILVVALLGVFRGFFQGNGSMIPTAFSQVLEQIVNNDPDVKDYMRVVMVENYNVSYAEKLIPACDISEQISLASKEASGTGNMKFMLNGAVTLGTADGANVEIHELVGDDNIYMFGQTSEQVISHYEKADYVSKEYYEKSPAIREAVDFIVGKQAMAAGHKENLERLHQELLGKDWFMTLLDLEDYIRTKDRMIADFEDRAKWKRMMLTNIAKSGFFSSDRTIREYNRDIWQLKETEDGGNRIS